MLVSIVIPHLNNSDRLFLLLEKLMPQLSGEIEVIIVDNGSKYYSIKGLEVKNVTLLQESDIISPYRCRNFGIRQSRGDLIILLDSNCVPAKDWLRSGLAHMQANELDVMSSTLRYEVVNESSVVSRFDYLYSFLDEKELLYMKSLPAGCLFVKRNVFDTIGLFLDDVRSLADVEWTSRAYNHNFKLGVAPSSILYYPGKDHKGFISKYFRLGRGLKECWHRMGYFGSVRWWILVFRHFLPPSIGFVRHFINKRKRMNLDLSIISIVAIGYYMKVLRGLGMVFGDKYVSLR